VRDVAVAAIGGPRDRHCYSHQFGNYLRNNPFANFRVLL